MNSVIWIVFTFAAFAAADPERDRFHGSLEQKLNSMDTKLQAMERKVDQLLERSCGSTGGGGASPGGRCDSGWTRSPEGTCIKVMTVAKTWIQAEANCRLSNAELVTITSERMNEFVQRQIIADSWIGLNDREQEGEWRWKDGDRELGAYSKWEFGNPHRNWDSYNCVIIRKSDGNWLDQGCDEQKRFVCQKRA